MPPKRCQLDEHREEIAELYLSGLTHDELINTINSRHGSTYSVTTLQRRLAAWGLNKGHGRRHTRTKADQRPAMMSRVAAMMASHSDSEMLAALRADNFDVGSIRVVRALRKQLGVYRRHQQNDSEYDEQIKAVVREEIANGNVATYGRRRYLWQHLKDKGVVVPRTRLIRMVQEVDPDGKYRCSRENNKGGKELGSLKAGLHRQRLDPQYQRDPQILLPGALEADSTPGPIDLMEPPTEHGQFCSSTPLQPAPGALPWPTAEDATAG